MILRKLIAALMDSRMGMDDEVVGCLSRDKDLVVIEAKEAPV